MEDVEDAISDSTKKTEGFFKYVFKMGDYEQSVLMNIAQYTVLAITRDYCPLCESLLHSGCGGRKEFPGYFSRNVWTIVFHSVFFLFYASNHLIFSNVQWIKVRRLERNSTYSHSLVYFYFHVKTQTRCQNAHFD